MDRLPGPRFFRMAFRIGTYGGRISVVQQQEARRRAEAAAQAPMSLSQWAARHRGAMERAHEQVRREGW